MRIIISFFVLISAFLSFSQRVSFEDPDLTFSFKKPKSWQVIDTGYEVKVFPSVKDSSSTYLIITYFEDAQPFGAFNIGQSAKTQELVKTLDFKIAKVSAKYSTQISEGLLKTNYRFYKLGQRFELRTSHLQMNNRKAARALKRMIRSIRVVE
ncbi:hypothetical protein [Ekhidna sp.]|uniref:hypothetical protein n=1 Tax=Ekhidna sp. TaxID=2608089 RepID=UPI00329A72E3